MDIRQQKWQQIQSKSSFRFLLEWIYSNTIQRIDNKIADD